MDRFTIASDDGSTVLIQGKASPELIEMLREQCKNWCQQRPEIPNPQ